MSIQITLVQRSWAIWQRGGVLPPAAFDCLVLTQTLHLVYDLASAVRQMHRALRPKGVVLLTVPGISRIDRGEWRESWCWSLTEASARRMFSDVFGTDQVEVETHGNVFAAVAFLGLVRKRGCAERQQGARARAIQGCQIGRVESPGKMKAPAFSRGFQREANEFDLGMDVA